MPDVVEFKMGGCGQNNIGHGGRRRHKNIRNSQKFELHEGFICFGAAGIHQQGIGALKIGCLYGVWGFFQDGFSEKCSRNGDKLGYDPVMGRYHFFNFIGVKIQTDKFSKA